MQKRKCPNGHIYDASIYGEQCPLCPPPGQDSSPAAGGPATQLGGDMYRPASSMSTRLEMPANPIGGGETTVASPRTGVNGPSGLDPTGATAMRPKGDEPGASDHTVIRRPPRPGQGKADVSGRRLVGFLVTYNRNPAGEAYNIYEGRNYIGRDASCDISVPDDSQMSGRHMSILYRNVDNKFKFRDEQSSNGTFINKELLDDGELSNYDIIRVGCTIFIFIAIPKIM